MATRQKRTNTLARTIPLSNSPLSGAIFRDIAILRVLQRTNPLELELAPVIRGLVSLFQSPKPHSFHTTEFCPFSLLCELLHRQSHTNYRDDYSGRLPHRLVLVPGKQFQRSLFL